nr:hypothetical protein [Tanacetum cinerariifolium]
KEKVLLALQVWILRKIHLDQYDTDLCSRAELVLEAKELLLPLAGADEGSFIVIPYKVSALNVDFDFKINLIVFGLETGSALVNFYSGGRGCYRLKIHQLNHN